VPGYPASCAPYVGIALADKQLIDTRAVDIAVALGVSAERDRDIGAPPRPTSLPG